MLTKTKETLFYQESTQTIRQAPQNFLIAHKDKNNPHRWIADPDTACNMEYATKIFQALFVHKARYGSGVDLLREAGFANLPQRLGE